MATGFLLAIVSYLATGIFLSPAFARYLWLIMALAGAACSIGSRLVLTPTGTEHEPVLSSTGSASADSGG